MKEIKIKVEGEKWQTALEEALNKAIKKCKNRWF